MFDQLANVADGGLAGISRVRAGQKIRANPVFDVIDAAALRFGCKAKAFIF